MRKIRSAPVLLIPWLVSAAPAELRAQGIPAIVALALDNSGSIRPRMLEQTRELALGILGNLPPGSEVAVILFNDQSQIVLERSADAQAVQRSVEAVTRAGRYTALHDALYDASRYLRDAPPARKAIVLITDGKDENSSLDLEDGLRVAQGGGIPVLAVGVGAAEERVLRRIAKLTGGEYVTIEQASGAALAERILAAAPPVAARALATPGAGPPAPAPAPREQRVDWMLLAAGVLALMALGGAGFYFAKLRGAGAEPSASGPSLETQDTGDQRTVVMRNPGAEPVEKTLYLAARPALTVLKGVGAGQSFPLSSQSSLSIGRLRGNDVTLDDASVSSEHCRIRPEDGRFVLHDLKSTNGTWVNDKRVARHALAEGDVIRIGETTLRFSLQGRSPGSDS